MSRNTMTHFTQRARRVLSHAQEAAEQMQHSDIGPEHLLVGLMRETGGVASRILHDLRLDIERVADLAHQRSAAGPRSPGVPLALSNGTKRILELAVDEARRMGHHYLGTEHLLLGLVRLPESVALEVLAELGVRPEDVRQRTRAVLLESPVATPGGAQSLDLDLVRLRVTEVASITHDDPVRAVLFSPEGNLMASVVENHTVHLVGMAAKDVLHAFPHESAVLLAAFSPDGRILATALADGTIGLWNVASGDRITTLEAHSGPVTALAFSADGRLLFSASEDKTLKLWQLSD